MGLDEKAVEAVSHWKFKPATINGRPVTFKANVEVNFKLL
jgi:TonB family protein